MDDLIGRQAAIDALAKAMPSLTTPDGCGQFDHDIYIAQETFVDSMQIIADLPSAERHGRWIEHEHGFWSWVNEKGERDGWIPDYECSLCRSRAWKRETNYCPNCGAKMDGEEEKNATD